MPELRGYQRLLLDKVAATLRVPYCRTMLQLPTGGGKTHIAGALLERWLANGHKAAWLTHRVELADQTCRLLNQVAVLAVSLRTWPVGDDAPTLPGGVVILMAQTAGRRTSNDEIWGGFDSDDLLIVDEAHHAAASGWERAIKQWPGRVLGATATPWRLSKTEGLDHLFQELHCGPQVKQLQAEGWLCKARMIVPKAEDLILGGSIAATGDYNEAGIVEANRDRADVLTAGALRFWELHASDRRSVVYAVSQDHARNLTSVFNEAGIPAFAILADTGPEERKLAIESFENGTLQVLINVSVATEGFDLPDASCVVITRPTTSLALYLQMIGRGLRPKPDGGDCRILDLAGNVHLHGLPDEDRGWSLSPRGDVPIGVAPVVRCNCCDCVSSAASHECADCGAPFGKSCSRCGRWRAWERWSQETECGDLHELVCDLCHRDAHIEGKLPINNSMQPLPARDGEANPVAIEALGEESHPFLRDLLEGEKARLTGADATHQRGLRSRISERESMLSDDSLLNQLFEKHLLTLPAEKRPATAPQKYRLYIDWETVLSEDLVLWRDQLAELETRAVDYQQVYSNSRERLLKMLESEARALGILQAPPHSPDGVQKVERGDSSASKADIDGWITLSELGDWGNVDRQSRSKSKVTRLRCPDGKDVQVNSWSHLMVLIGEWLVSEGLLVAERCPCGPDRGTRYLIHTVPVHSNGAPFKNPRRLSNGFFLESNHKIKTIARICGQLVAEFGVDPEMLSVRIEHS